MTSVKVVVTSEFQCRRCNDISWNNNVSIIGCLTDYIDNVRFNLLLKTRKLLNILRKRGVMCFSWFWSFTHGDPGAALDSNCL